MFKKLLLSLILPLNSSAFANTVTSGYELGNGGMLLKCSPQSDVGEGLFSLDRIEGALAHNLKPAPFLQTLNNEEHILDLVLKRLEEVDPPRAKRFQNWFREIIESREFLTEIPLATTDDSGFVMKPAQCDVQQGAVFITDAAQKKIRFLFDKNLYNSASPLDRAYLLLHELIYREARLSENNHFHSVPSRYLTAWLMNHIDNLSDISWISALRTSTFLEASYKGMPLILTYRNPDKSRRLAPLKFYPSGTIHKAILRSQFRISINGQLLDRSGCDDLAAASFVSSESVEFFESGAIKHITFDPSQYEKCALYKGKFNDLEFDKSGKLTRAQHIQRIPVVYNFEE